MLLWLKTSTTIGPSHRCRACHRLQRSWSCSSPWYGMKPYTARIGWMVAGCCWWTCIGENNKKWPWSTSFKFRVSMLGLYRVRWSFCSIWQNCSNFHQQCRCAQARTIPQPTVLWPARCHRCRGCCVVGAIASCSYCSCFHFLSQRYVLFVVWTCANGSNKWSLFIWKWNDIPMISSIHWNLGDHWDPWRVPPFGTMSSQLEMMPAVCWKNGFNMFQSSITGWEVHYTWRF